ncbi:hypothetical protein L6Q96_23060, partial [Candidatus Binatia bacterium]|nr:hypothetical protein [Candidatus Binatia bacterium]
LYDYGARFYDPQLVQFVSQDPVREYLQPYAYVGWNPVRYTDPTGMFVGLGGEMAAMSQAMPIQSFFYHNIATSDFASVMQYRGIGYGGFNGPAGGGRGGGLGFVGGGLRAGSAEGQAVTLAAMLTGILGGDGRAFASAASEAIRAGFGFSYDLEGGAGSVSVDPVGEGAAQGYAVSLSPHDGSVGPTVEGVMTGAAIMAAGGAIAWTGGVLAQAGMADLSHLSSAVGAQSGIGVALVPLAMIGDSMLLTIGGGALLFGSGFLIGVGINDYLLAPALGTPTVWAGYSHLKGN